MIVPTRGMARITESDPGTFDPVAVLALPLAELEGEAVMLFEVYARM